VRAIAVEPSLSWLLFRLLGPSLAVKAHVSLAQLKRKWTQKPTIIAYDIRLLNKKQTIFAGIKDNHLKSNDGSRAHHSTQMAFVLMLQIAGEAGTLRVIIKTNALNLKLGFCC
jgi:hypothetical protein